MRLRILGMALVAGAARLSASPGGSTVDLTAVRARAKVDRIEVRSIADQWRIRVHASDVVLFQARTIAEGHRFYVDFRDCKLATGEPTYAFSQSGLTVRASQFSIDPAVVRVVVLAPTGADPRLRTPAPAREAELDVPLSTPPATRTEIEISRMAPPAHERRSRIRSRLRASSRGGAVHRPDPESLVIRPDALEAYDEPPVPSDGGSLDLVLGASLSGGVRDGVRAALAGTHRYVWGGTRPDGFDCSGMMQFIFRRAGVRLPRTAAEQFLTGEPVESNDLRPGDLVFFATGGRIFHVAMYLGEGRIFHAANPTRGLTTDLLTKSFYARHYAGARRHPVE